MKMPYRYRARVAPEKLTKYLLNKESKEGRSKAEALGKHGYTRENWEELERMLISIAQTKEFVSRSIEEFYGIQYIFIETLPQSERFPALRPPERFRMVWQIDYGKRTPRFITAYPEAWRSRPKSGSSR